jgi:AraC-like DNA-binding protein
MKFFRRIPASPLGQHIEWLWYYEDLLPQHQREHVLPDGTFEMMLNLEDRPRRLFDRDGVKAPELFKRGWVSGAQRQYLVIDALEGSSMIGAHFKPGGAARFLDMPAGDLCDAVVEMDELWGAGVWEWRDRILEARSPERKFDLLEHMFQRRLLAERSDPQHARMAGWAVERFLRQPRVSSIKSVSDSLGLSQKHFIEVFRREVGMTPKRFCRIQRFQKVLQQLKGHRSVDWSDVVWAGGYSDQSHFIHEFTAFSGLKPSVYLDRKSEEDPRYVGARN